MLGVFFPASHLETRLVSTPSEFEMSRSASRSSSATTKSRCVQAPRQSGGLQRSSIEESHQESQPEANLSRAIVRSHRS